MVKILPAYLYLYTQKLQINLILIMQRRSAIKNLTLAVGGLVSLPAWASRWTPDSIGKVSTSVVSEDNQMILAEIVETIIPETSTPGAKSLKVNQFIMRMVNDCYGEPVQSNFKKGLTLIDDLAKQSYGKAFTSCDALQKADVFNKMRKSDDTSAKQFTNMVKNLTIQGYMNSEYVLVNLLNYNMAPGFYHGCVPIGK
ncbi:Gluconate 2-dehydrogenase subunit 3 [Pseudarcicella hirudinis]|uniref:Gluconate 2-dehydrogenase subunit 3 n=2 Tax=Pseudarcicella hirudinis TaxID=1079859 RepID=A0A1I5N1F6_9BACT|nr:Gluconate 2-dehydrogenase subunit 3 [Pseudarcicella hirudinis]